ncbi:MAG: hypothetical protein MUO26_03245 [Methanotrichaceae archaeon]|nr:hypothetical protein [Methanotrichaceae archaeon]
MNWFDSFSGIFSIDSLYIFSEILDSEILFNEILFDEILFNEILLDTLFADDMLIKNKIKTIKKA